MIQKNYHYAIQVDLVSQNPVKMGPFSSKIGENVAGADFGRN